LGGRSSFHQRAANEVRHREGGVSSENARPGVKNLNFISCGGQRHLKRRASEAQKWEINITEETRGHRGRKWDL